MEVSNETLDLSKRGMQKIEKATTGESATVVNLILDQNELNRLDNIDTYTRVENLSVCNNFLMRMHGVSRLTNIHVLALNNNGILQIEGLKDLTCLKVLKLAGNSIKSIEHLNHNMHLEHLDLSNNQISIIADISYLKNLKHLNLERNRIIDLRQCERFIPSNLEHLGLAHNNIQDLNEISHLVHLTKLDSFSVQGNPCVAMAGKDKLGFDYRPFVLNWILSIKSIDGFVVSAIESLKAEWLYSQGKGRHFHLGQHQELCEYLASTCPITADALETEDQRKLRLILSKAQHHQQQLKDQTSSPIRSKLQSPRMQSRITPRHMGRSPDRLTSSYHSGVGSDRGHTESPSFRAMTTSCDERALSQAVGVNKPRVVQEPANKPINQSLEAASKMVPVPESLMSPDYQDPIYDIHRTIPKPTSNNSSLHEDRRQANKNLKGSPKLTKSATSSPRLKSKMEQRKGSLTKIETNDKKMPVNGKINGNTETNQSEVKVANQRKKKISPETSAAVTIQKMWRGYRSRNLNKDTMRILHAIQAARARQHIQKLTCDMEATKAALESERKIQQLQMQAINALWKKVSTLQDTQKHKSSDPEDNSDILRQLTETCFNLQSQVVDLQSCMQEVLKAVSSKNHSAPVATQTDITALITPQEERCTWLKRPQSLPLSAATVTPVVENVHIVNEPENFTEKSITLTEERDRTQVDSPSATETDDQNTENDIQDIEQSVVVV